MALYRRYLRQVLPLLVLLTLGSTAWTQQPVSLMEPAKENQSWEFGNGPEFPGATGKLTVDPAAQREGRDSLHLEGDFTKGGNYVQMGRKIPDVDIRELVLWVRNPDAEQFTVRLNDGSGQTHQIVLKAERRPDWQRVVFPLERFFASRGRSDAVTTVARYESWGGAKDGKWHGPATAIYILVGRGGDVRVRNLWVQDVAITPPSAPRPPAFQTDFEASGDVPPGWTIAGDVAVETGRARGSRSLALARTLENIDRPVSAAGPTFAVTPGQWRFSAASRSELQSPDSSYSGTAQVELLDGAGKVRETVTVADIYGRREWQPASRTVDVPAGATAARFVARINKASGRFWVDNLSATYVAPSRDDSIARLMFGTPQLGNLLYPGDPRKVDVIVEATRPLGDSQRTVTYVVRDYWGAEQTRPATVTIERREQKGDRTVYEGIIDLGNAPLEIGRYYELHASIPHAGDEPYRDYTSFAILPEAENRRYKPEEVPFTSRSWDNRVPAHVQLTDRLGVRIAGLWGGWSDQPPYNAEAPQLDLVQKLGMGWLTGTPAAGIERGETKYSEEALRQGVRNLIAKFGHVRPLIVNLGNEPHGKGERVLKNVAAYRVLYEEIKKVDPGIFVVATSVEPNEEYFAAGYGKYCDAYDFHIYESHEDVRRTIGEYQALMKKYGVVHPIWSTELGLNSQGMTRQTVAVQLYKKFAAFFAAGGANVSWFGLLYPDPDAKLTGSSGEAHNVFDTRYSRYAPKLDAVAYYNAVNAIGIKKFVAEKRYADDISAFLFRDRNGRSLQILWKDKGRQDVSLPLPGAKQVQVIRLDGARRTLNADGKALTLTIGEDPLLLLYDGGPATLPATLPAPAATLTETPATLTRGGTATLTVTPSGAPAADLDLLAPAFWTVKKQTVTGAGGKPAVRFTVTAPQESEAREADFIVTVGPDASHRGELYWRGTIAGR